jgi:hypothetical protein
MSNSKPPSGRTAAECLEKVPDYKTFRDFVWTLIEEREAAEELERAEPDRWKCGGPMGWQHADISEYLASRMQYFSRRGDSLAKAQPTWRDLAQFLYYGKIYE